MAGAREATWPQEGSGLEETILFQRPVVLFISFAPYELMLIMLII